MTRSHDVDQLRWDGSATGFVVRRGKRGTRDRELISTGLKMLRFNFAII